MIAALKVSIALSLTVPSACTRPSSLAHRAVVSPSIGTVAARRKHNEDALLQADTGRHKNTIPASWFEHRAKQVDGFEREKFDSRDWQERSVNSTLSCKAPGCMANISLLAPFDHTKEISKNCRFSIFFHPTDFDDQYSGERVEWVQVNGKMVSSNCRPMAGGCNETAQRPLIACVNDVPIDHIMKENGDLSIAAKIPKVVDECPYKGNLLSAVPMVTCLVKSKPSTPQLPKPVLVKSKKPPQALICVTRVPLQCATRGCTAEVLIDVGKACGVHYGQCKLSVNVSQTDYDNHDGTNELIEYIKVAGKEVASKLKPGQNPCKTKWKGKAATTASYDFSALTDHAVDITNGMVLVEGKISQYVDECASNGYLFDSMAELTCKPEKASLLSQRRKLLPANRIAVI